MHRSIGTVATLTLICLAEFSFSFQDPSIEKKDTVLEKTIQFEPNFSKKKIRSLGNYTAVVDDSLTFQFSSGISVFNALRGRVPNTGISVDASFATVRDNASIVIDGLLYRQSSANFYNMNAFDYTSVAVLTRGNSASAYGVYGGNGAFVIKSKTGEGYSEPTFEFNAYSTAAGSGRQSGTTSVGSPNLPRYTGSDLDGRSYLSHAIAYMQDFGKVDTRISYNWVKTNSRVNNHNIKINTGLSLHPKFKARLIVDNLYNVFHNSSSVSQYFVSDSSNYIIGEIRDSLDQVVDSVFHYVHDSVVVTKTSTHHNRNLLQGNLMLQYEPTRWLSLTSQSSLGKVTDSENINGENTIDDRSVQRRSLLNFFATVSTNKLSSFSLSPFIGFEYESWDYQRRRHTTDNTHISSNTSSAAYTEKYYLTGVDISVKNILFGHFDHRQDISSKIPSGKQNPTHSASLAFVFTEAFGWNSHTFSSGKIRGSIGRMYKDKYSNNNLIRVPEKVFEIGSDMNFAHDRINVTLNYFNDKERHRSQAFLPNSGFYSGSSYDGDQIEKGYEFIVSATPVRVKQLEYKTTLLWMSTKTIIERNSSYSYGLDAPDPGWTSSLLNQVTWKNFALNLLIDAREGGTFYSYAGSSDGVPILDAFDGTQVKLRDLTIGYRFPTSILKYIRIKQAYVSTSARNMVMLYSSSGKDVEESYSIAPKSMSMNLSLLF